MCCFYRLLLNWTVSLMYCVYMYLIDVSSFTCIENFKVQMELVEDVRLFRLQLSYHGSSSSWRPRQERHAGVMEMCWLESRINYITQTILLLLLHLFKGFQFVVWATEAGITQFIFIISNFNLTFNATRPWPSLCWSSGTVVKPISQIVAFRWKVTWAPVGGWMMGSLFIFIF